MEISDLKKYYKNDKVILSAKVKRQEEEFELFYAYDKKYSDLINESADAFMAAALIPAMYYNENLKCNYPVSKTLIDNFNYIQDVFTTWYPKELHRIKIESKIKTSDNIKTEKIKKASFFSLGVDSFYSLLKEQNLDYLVFMKGVELPLLIYDNYDFDPLQRKLEKVANHYNVELIIGETNLRDHFKINWENLYSGGGLSSVAISLGNQINQFLIPSSFSYNFSPPSASSLQTDSYWSTGQQHIIHHGCEATRVSKLTDYISKDEFALNNLRICLNNDGGAENCGECRKCITAMLSLDITGELKKCSALPNNLPKDYFLYLIPYNKYYRYFIDEIYDLAKKYNRHDVVRKLKIIINFATVIEFRDDRTNKYGVFSKWVDYILFKIKYLLRKRKIEKQEEKNKKLRADISAYYNN